jgi:hypothetical protein
LRTTRPWPSTTRRSTSGTSRALETCGARA